MDSENDDFEPYDLKSDDEDDTGFRQPLPPNDDAASDASSDGDEEMEKRHRTDSESTMESVTSEYSIGSNISNMSHFSMMSTTSTLSSGGIFKTPEAPVELPPSSSKATPGPDMSQLREMKNKQKRTEMYVKLLRQKRKVRQI